MFKNVHKFVRKRKKVNNFIDARGKKVDNRLYAGEERSTLLNNISKLGGVLNMSYVIYEGGWPFCYEMSRRGVGGGGKKKVKFGLRN